MDDSWNPTRRDVLGTAGGGVAGAGWTAITCSTGVQAAATVESGEPTSLEEIAALARGIGDGEPLTTVDLAALDDNIDRVVAEVTERNWHVRPALKSFRSPEFAAYVLARLPDPRGMIFHLRPVAELLDVLPENPDLMLGYVPTVGELEAYFARDGSDEPPHRLRLTLDAPELVRACADVAREGNREVPVEVALEFDSGMQRGGIKNETELGEAIDILRENRDVLELTATLCYDGHATVDGNEQFRRTVADDAQRRYREFLAQLREDAGDLVDVDALVRNGPGSSNYQHWDPEGPATEVSPGTAFVYHGYLQGRGFDNEGLQRTLVHGAPVMRIPADGPRTPLFGVEPPWGEAGAVEDGVPDEDDPGRPHPEGYEEVLTKGGAWPSNEGDQAEMVYPEGMEDDPSSGGRGNNTSAVLAPKGSLELGEYVLLRPQIAGDGIDYFGALHAIRDGELQGLWPTRTRWHRPRESGTPGHAPADGVPPEGTPPDT
jgi:D-serine deaminase-like pyridoxal phosphate-dependent protein